MSKSPDWVSKLMADVGYFILGMTALVFIAFLFSYYEENVPARYKSVIEGIFALFIAYGFIRHWVTGWRCLFRSDMRHSSDCALNWLHTESAAGAGTDRAEPRWCADTHDASSAGSRPAGFEEPRSSPARGFSLQNLRRIIAMNDGFPPHIVGFMNRKREKEKREEKAWVFGLTALEKIFYSVGDLASLSSPASKNIFVFVQPKSPAYCSHPVPQEGALAIVTDVGTGCGGREGFRRESADVWSNCVRRSRVVLTPQGRRQVLEKLALLRSDGVKPNPWSPGRARSKP
jgi:hypothetical protein